MSETILKSYQELVELKYQLYNSLFLTLPLDAIEQTGLLLPLLQEACSNGLKDQKSPEDIINEFFREHKTHFTEAEQIPFLFKVVQYVERQIVLIDALEEAAYNKIHRIGDSDSWSRISTKVKNRQLEEKARQVMENFGVRVVLTAHPTQFYPGAVLAIASDLKSAIEKGDVALSRDLLQQLGKTPFYRKQKPTAYNEALSLMWYLSNVFYPAVGELLDRIEMSFPRLNEHSNQLIQLGFWPGGDRDGNPFVKVDTTLKVAERLRFSITGCYAQDIKELKRRLSFKGVSQILEQLDTDFLEDLTGKNRFQKLNTSYLLDRLNEVEILLKKDHQSLFLDKLQSFQRKVKTFGFHFASIDIRQDSRMIGKAFAELIHQIPSLLPVNWEQLPAEAQINFLISPKEKIQWIPLQDEVLQDTLESFGVIMEIQKKNGETGAHRYIISNCRGPLDMARVFALAHWCSWGKQPLSLDIVPLFETVDDLSGAGQSMQTIYQNYHYQAHLKQRKMQQTVMLGFSDGTKDGGYLTANWAILKAKEQMTAVSRENQVEVLFFDGRGGPPARGGGNAHLFYSAMGKKVESQQIQMTVQGQTISSHYGIQDAAVHNLGHLLTAGIENNLFNKPEAELNEQQRKLIENLSKRSFEKYEALKQHPLFIPFLEERSTLKYYGMANIGSRPSKRGKSEALVFDDLRAIPFVGAWSQLKQNVPGFYGLGTALLTEGGHDQFNAYKQLYQDSVFFKALISNSMQSMSKTNFALTAYMKNDPKFGAFWNMIHEEFQLTKKLVLEISGQKELLEDNARSRKSIQLREKVVLPLLIIQQYALTQIQKNKEGNNDRFLKEYEKMVMRSLFGNINASRNSV
jgi:phosphoenolpyruvate carboxylase